MRVRIVVADMAEARFYDMARIDAKPTQVGQMVDENARLKDRELAADRPGRVFDHAPGPGRRGAVAHHAADGERSPRRHEAESFARRVAGELEQAQRKQGFERIVLMAPPQFLGLLRTALPASLRSMVTAEINKGLVHQDDDAILAHLPTDLLWE